MATQAIELDKDAFMRLVTEDHLQVEGPTAGYLYAGRKGKTGWELYKTPNNPWYFYQARRVLTSPVGGGVLVVRISIPTGTVARIGQIYVQGAASATTLDIFVLDEDGAQTSALAAVAAGASRAVNLPTIGVAASTNNNLATSIDMFFGPGTFLYFRSAASLQNETLTVGISMLLSTNTEPTWDTTGAVAGATLAASTISAANTIQMVAMP